MSSDSENGLQCTPPDLREAANNVVANLLPTNSKEIYESAYEAYVSWKRSKDANITSESVVLAYFNEMAKKYKPTTIWSLFSKLKGTIKIKEKIDIGTYSTLGAFMKKQSRGFRSKKSNVFTPEEVKLFLTTAPNEKYLASKVILIFGVFGALRTDELTNVEMQHIKQQGSLLQVQVPKTKTMQPRSFVISEECVKYVEEYQSLRPEKTSTNRFFVNYQNGKCTSQVIGKNKFSSTPKQIAEFLGLPDPASYTGHSFRRTSATLLVDNGANMETLKRHGGWKSNEVAEGYIAESLGNKTMIGNLINSSINLTSGSNENHDSNKSPSSKRFKRNDSLNVIASSSKVNLNPEQKTFHFENCANVTINFVDKPQ